MITAVEPEVDIVDKAFNEYVVKPATKQELPETVEMLLVRHSFGGYIQECFSLVSERTALEVSTPTPEHESRPEYRERQDRIADLERRATERLDDLIDRGVVSWAYTNIDQ